MGEGAHFNRVSIDVNLPGDENGKLSVTANLDPATSEAIRLFLERVSEKYDVSQAMLFGSKARQTAHSESDTDVAVLLRGKRDDLLKTKLSMADMAYDVLLETGVLIQALPIWEEEWQHPETYSNPYLLANIAREGLRL